MSATRRRSLTIEALEDRQVLSASSLLAASLPQPPASAITDSYDPDLPAAVSSSSNTGSTNLTSPAFSHRNPALRLDVNGDGKITPFDAVPILVFLKQHGNAAPSGRTPPYLDTVPPDNLITALDALAVLTYVQKFGVRPTAPSATNVSSSAPGSFSAVSPQQLLAENSAEGEQAGLRSSRPADAEPMKNEPAISPNRTTNHTTAGSTNLSQVVSPSPPKAVDEALLEWLAETDLQSASASKRFL